MIRSRSLLLVLGALTVSAAPALADGDHKFCETYAKEAVRQFHDVSSHPKCHGLLQDEVRYNGDEHKHLDWCLHTDKRHADSERDARRRALEGCRK